MLLVANEHTSFRPFSEAIPEQSRLQSRGGCITRDIVRGKGAEALDECRDCGLPTRRIFGIKPTVHNSSKLNPFVRGDLQDREADHSLRCMDGPSRKTRQW